MSEWQPIESAPKDGTRILTFCERAGVEVAWWHVEGEEWASADCDVYQPTHWQPLPEPPQ